MREALPWEEWFSNPAPLRDALAEAGLTGIDVQHREYRITMSVAEFLSIRETSLEAKVVRERLDAREWERFRERVAHELNARFRDPIEDTRDAYLAVGTKPSS